MEFESVEKLDQENLRKKSMIKVNHQAEDILCRMEYLILTKEESAAIISACRVELAVWNGDLSLPDRIARRAKGIDANLRKHLSDEVAIWMHEPVIEIQARAQDDETGGLSDN